MYPPSVTFFAHVPLYTCRLSRCVATFTGHRGDCYTVCPSSTGLPYGTSTHKGGRNAAQTVFCSGGYDRTVRLFRPFGTKIRGAVQTLTGHGASVTSVAFGSHGGLVVSGSKDSTIKFWDINSGVCGGCRIFHCFFRSQSRSFGLLSHRYFQSTLSLPILGR